MNRETICIYHSNCADGFGAAWAVRKALGDIEFFPGKYSQSPPDVAGKRVIMVDFSYKRPVLMRMAEKARSILILDHHASAEKDLVDLPTNVIAMFDMAHSGAMLAWRYFFPNAQPPELLYHIEDRDLWKFALKNTREIQAAVFSYPYDFDVWDKLMSTDIDELVAEGITLERKHFKDINELLPQVTRQLTIGGYTVPAANVPYTLASDVGHMLSIGQPFAACYYDKANTRSFGLRSDNDGIDVSEVAALYGGGGHPHAAGFEVSFEVARTLEVGHD